MFIVGDSPVRILHAILVYIVDLFDLIEDLIIGLIEYNLRRLYEIQVWLDFQPIYQKMLKLPQTHKLFVI